jgi:hypothetical protein
VDAYPFAACVTFTNCADLALEVGIGAAGAHWSAVKATEPPLLAVRLMSHLSRGFKLRTDLVMIESGISTW